MRKTFDWNCKLLIIQKETELATNFLFPNILKTLMSTVLIKSLSLIFHSPIIQLLVQSLINLDFVSYRFGLCS